MAVSAISLAAHAQGVLTVTPGRVAATAAGTGALGFAGDNAAAVSAALASPSAIAYDASGNLYLADSNNHLIREVLKATGTITTVAGTGIAGFSGDGGAATAAQLDTPTGITLDASGNLFVADSHNHRIRRVDPTGTITTIAGTGTAGFSGDGAQATAAQLALPSAVAIDANGRLLIADTNNQRIRAVVNGTITTVAGNGEELFAGDGGAATAASLDQPTGIAIDSGGNLYIADTHNHRVRVVNAAGTISTFAGNGAAPFSGSFAGDGAAATAAALARPTGVAVDTNGNLLIADTNNQRIRQVTGGTIATLAGSGEQGFSGDGSALTATALNAPRAALTDAAGDLLIADTLNQRLRSGNLPTLAFATQAIGTVSSAQSLTLANTGTANLSITQLSTSGAFTATTGGTCTALPITLAPGASCTESVAFTPTAIGATSGAVVTSGTGLLPQTVLLSGTGTQGGSKVTLTANTASALVGQPVTFTATVQPGGNGAVVFYDGATQLGTAQPLVNNTAALTLTTLAAGTHNITATYTGATGTAPSTSAPLLELIGDFDFTIASGASTGNNQTVIPGRTATYAFTVQPLAGPFNFPITLSATGLPAGATVTFTPQTVNLGATPASFTMSIKTSATVTALHRDARFGGGTLAFALFLLPFSGTLRRRARQLGPLALSLTCIGTGLMLTTLTGCATANGFFGQPQKTYTIQVIGTAQGANGTTLQHVANVQLTVE